MPTSALVNARDWQNTLELPPRGSVSESIARLELKFGFTVCEGTPLQLFVSEKTNFMVVSQLIGFFPTDIGLYTCPDALLQERLYYLSLGHSDTESNRVSTYLNDLFETAVINNATDIHIEEGENQTYIRMRVNGALENMAGFDKLDDGIRVKIKLLSGLNISESRRPQEGALRFNSSEGKRFSFRVSISPGIYHEKIALRILPDENLSRNLADLGFAAYVYDALLAFSRRNKGWLIVCGPTGSGKTTTLYGLLHEMSSRGLSIETIEDPVEYRLENVHQTQVAPELGLGFAESLKHALRLDPDVILVGEMRDEETATLALKAAQTGHMVLSTLHSSSPKEALNRLKHLGLPPDDIYSTLTMVISQLLVRGPRPDQYSAPAGSFEYIPCRPENTVFQIDPAGFSLDSFVKLFNQHGIPDELTPFYRIPKPFGT